MDKYANKKFLRWGIVAVLLMTLVMSLLTGCGNHSNTENVAKVTGDGGVAEQIDIPQDGIISADIFAKIQGLDQTIHFTGKDEASGIAYDWAVNGKNIRNPTDMNLKVTFVTEGLEEIQKASDGADYVLGMTLTGKGLITIPTLTVTLTKKWNTNSGVLCKNQDGQLSKITDVSVDNSDSNTKLTSKIMELGDTYYFLAGKIVQKETETAAEGSAQETTGETKETTAETSQAAQINETTDVQEPNQTQSQETIEEKPAEQTQKETTTEAETEKKLTCTISIECSTILDNKDKLNSSKEEFVPSDGWILKATETEFEAGESVHDVLKRVCKENGIHMESSFTPAYNSAYVEGINQLYEFDCGELSGWMYEVNDWFPNYGCSVYELSDGDVIEWHYTCDLGKDVGDNSMY